ncbi:DNA alkylation repair protein [Marinoscillum furvescens]|uniref:3-methyladenine DNA glycosylase AlkD n=1 Tax=Marinoscillum furvescens DSM 4134 TaxID=1122208 RepID=A0A3D9L6E6_MARFU|nr:DNA alkylation repair protein [Marinoscillum furvescens]REE01044.1 3-methyladenine DNA glycosylase AlkD [Marinoscillum furvescens DSM 4134]
MDYQTIIAELHALANPEKAAFKQKKFGIVATNAFGIYMSDLNALARKVPKDADLALQLIASDIYEARLLGAKVYPPKDLTPELMDSWITTFDNWEICDTFCMGLFAKSKHALPKISEWAHRKPLYEKRAAFATLAAYCMADKKAENETFEDFYPLIKAHARDDRDHIRKAISWALRSIGKRNKDLKISAIACAEDILMQGTRSGIWIAKDVLKELQKTGLRSSDYPRSIYRPG